MKSILIAFLTLTLLLISSTALASSIRCRNNVVKTGDHRTTVLKKCGPPTWKENDGSLWIYVTGRQQFTVGLQFSSTGRLQFIRHEHAL